MRRLVSQAKSKLVQDSDGLNLDENSIEHGTDGGSGWLVRWEELSVNCIGRFKITQLLLQEGGHVADIRERTARCLDSITHILEALASLGPDIMAG
jgi:hypothetical protein